MIRFLTILILTCLTAFADSPWQYFPTTNEMISAAIPVINTNLTATLGGLTSTNDGWGGTFQYKTNSTRTIDMFNIFAAFGGTNGGRWMRIYQPVGTNAPGPLTVAGNLLPATDATYNLGSASKQWENLSLSGSLTLSAIPSAGILNVTSGGLVSSEAQVIVAHGGTAANTFTKGVLVSPGTTSAFTTIAGTTGYFPYWSSSYPTATSPIFTDGSNVGIGTTGPGAALHVAQGSTASIALQSTGGASSSFYMSGAGGNYIGYDNTFNLSTFSTIGGAMTPKVTVLSTGNVGIGTTSSGSTLTVNGGVYIGSGSTTVGANNIEISGDTKTATETVSGNLTLSSLSASLPLKLTSGNIVTAASINLAGSDITGALGNPHGGTGASTYNQGDLLVGEAGNTLVKLAGGTTGYVLTRTATTNIWAAPAAGTAGNPSALVGLTAVNGSATTYMRSDGAPALDQSIAPTWTGKHTWTGAATTTTISGWKVVGDSTDRISIRGDGRVTWSDGSGGFLTILEDNLSTGNLDLTGNLRISGLNTARYIKTDGNSALSTLQTESANTIFAGPVSGSAAIPGFRAMAAGDISGLIGSVSPTANNNEVIGSSTNYLTTGTMARVDFGSGDPQVTITAGKWLVTAIVQIGLVGLTAGSTQTELEFFNSTDGVPIANSFRSVPFTAAGSNQGIVQNIINVSGTKIIQLYARANPDLSVGTGNPSLNSTNTTITAINLSN